MKKVIILVMTAFLVISFTSFASAVTVAPTPFTQTLLQAQFNVVDLDGDGFVELRNISESDYYTLQYRVGSSTGWNSAEDYIGIETAEYGTERVHFRYLGEDQSVLAMATMTFLSPISISPNHYRSAQMDFSPFVDGYTYAAYGKVVGKADGISPVPIPAAAWLLGTGLIGLVGIRRRFTK